MFGSKRKIHDNLRVGKAQTSPDRPAHVRGVREGNKLGAIQKEAGLHQDPRDSRFAAGSAARSTGINPGARNPIDPSSPNLSPC